MLVVSLLTMQSGRDDLMDKAKEEVISEGPETQGGECFTGLTVECPTLTVSPWIGCGEPDSGVSGFNGVSLAVVSLR